MLLDLNTDCIHEVLSFLPLEAILDLAPLSYTLHDVVGSVELWQHLISIHTERSPAIQAGVDAILRWVAEPSEAIDAVKNAPLQLARVAACIRDKAPPVRIYQETFAAVVPFADARRTHTLVRIRPPNRREVEMGVPLDAVRRTGLQEVTVNDERKEHTFEADAVIEAGGTGLAAQQRELWGHLGPVLVDRAVRQGVDQCVMAYGETGSGKRTSVLGAELEGDLAGLLPRTVAALLAEASAMNAAAVETDGAMRDRATVDIECVEIYSERVRDLLDEDWKTSADMKVRSYPAPKRQKGLPYDTVTVGLRRQGLTTVNHSIEVIGLSRKHQSVHSTMMGAATTRAHLIYRVGYNRSINGGTATRRTTVTFLVFAGSERPRVTGASGSLLREGVRIHLGTQTPSNIINMLNKRERNTLLKKKEGHHHVPYRDSRLTHMLQPCFGGNCCTYLLGHLSPTAYSADESVSTMQFAARFRGLLGHGLRRNPWLSQEDVRKSIERQALGPQKVSADGEEAADDPPRRELPEWCEQWLTHVLPWKPFAREEDCQETSPGKVSE